MPLAEPPLSSALKTEQAAPSRRWLSIVGIGEDGVPGLSAAARELVRAAAFVFGGKRHLALAASLPETVLLSLHGHPLDLLRPHLQPGARLLALTSGSDAPADLAHLLRTNGFGSSRVTVLEALGAPGERIREAMADHFDLDGIAPSTPSRLRLPPSRTRE